MDMPPAFSPIEKRALAEDSFKPEDGEKLNMLGNTFVLWYLENERNREWKDCVKEIGAFESVQGCLAVYLAVKPPSNLAFGYDYMLFKEGVKPMWEDENNRNGGRWRVSIESRKNHSYIRTDSYWHDLMEAFVEGHFADSEDILGIVVNRRSKGDKISVWTRDASNEEATERVGKELKKLLGMPKSDKMAYFAHKMEAGQAEM
ncbi:hypothetical protein L596_016965 [Steinernema carpocapsae]|uniref:eIF-4F 25 kDa subunit n=1 Tax=Steinernema carpocapsae TaxID=34508 RepID=A0A4U5N106_STECR|nr:hypothetical protein L596_016965 [Steinernema carpocapsae]